MEKNMSHIHDKMFKETFGNHVIAGDFLKAFLPESVRNIVDLDTLKPIKGSFVTQELKEVFTDLLFTAMIDGNDGYICFLFEHKSYPDKNVIYQIQKYIIEIWVNEDNAKKAETLPVVIPLLIYNGKNRWNYKTSIREKIRGFSELSGEVSRLLPVYDYLLYDLSAMDTDLKTVSAMQLILRVMRDVMQLGREEIIATIADIMVVFEENLEDDKITYYTGVCLKYVLSVKSDITKEDLLSIANHIPREGSELIMTLAEQLKQEGRQEGRQEGLQEGMQKGRLETTTKIARNALSMSLKVEDIMKLTGLTMEELDEIKREMPQ